MILQPDECPLARRAGRRAESADREARILEVPHELLVGFGGHQRDEPWHTLFESTK
jgi:hypothetical protein